MKKIIIAGAPRTGKTTLAKRLFDHYHYNLIQGDILNSSIQFMYYSYMAEKKGDYTYIVDVPKVEEIKNYVQQMYFQICSHDDIYDGVIFDTSFPSAEKLKEYEEEGCIVVVLGCADITAEQFFENIRTYDTPLDRTYYLGNTTLHMEVKAHVKSSQKYKKECERLGLTYIETSHNRKESLEKAYQIITEKIENSPKVS